MDIRALMSSVDASTKSATTAGDGGRGVMCGSGGSGVSGSARSCAEGLCMWLRIIRALRRVGAGVVDPVRWRS